MVNVKTILLLLLFGSAIVSCTIKTYPFKSSEEIGRQLLLTRTLKDGKRHSYKDLQAFCRADVINVYKVVFREYYVENDALIEYALLNEVDEEMATAYEKGTRYEYDLFLMVFDQLDTLQRAEKKAIFFTVQKNVAKKVIGFSDVLAGSVSYNGQLVIHFQERYTIKTKSTKKEKEGIDVNQSFYTKFSDSTDIRMVYTGGGNNFNITKIIYPGNNEIGGDRSLAMLTEKLFGKADYLNFKLDTVIIK